MYANCSVNFKKKVANVHYGLILSIMDIILQNIVNIVNKLYSTFTSYGSESAKLDALFGN